MTTNPSMAGNELVSALTADLLTIQRYMAERKNDRFEGLASRLSQAIAALNTRANDGEAIAEVTMIDRMGAPCIQPYTSMEVGTKLYTRPTPDLTDDDWCGLYDAMEGANDCTKESIAKTAREWLKGRE